MLPIVVRFENADPCVLLTRAAQLITSVWDTIAKTVSAGQMQGVQRRLSQELRDVFSEVPLRS